MQKYIKFSYLQILFYYITTSRFFSGRFFVFQKRRITFAVQFTDDFRHYCAPITLTAKWTATHTVAFNSDGGSAVPAQTIRDGNKVNRPANPTKAWTAASGLYLGTPPTTGNYTFDGWYYGATLWNFDNAVTQNITLTARWSITGSFTRIESVLSNDVTGAFAYVNANANYEDEYTLLLGTNVAIGGQTLNAAAKLIIMGIGEERSITVANYATQLFLIDGNNATNLTFGQNITLNNNSGTSVVSVRRGILTMCNGSKVTGFGGSSGTGWSAVSAEGSNATFKMEGGEISGNNSFLYNSGTCVQVYNGATFEMSGGSISGNNNWAHDLNIGHDCTFRMSGNARIGTLALVASDATRSSINIVGSYNGTVTRLHLRGYSYWDAYPNTVISWWTNALLIVNGTTNVINMFNNCLGNFAYSTPITATHVLNSSGRLVLREN